MTALSLRTKIITRLGVISLCAMTVLLLFMYRYISRTLQVQLAARGQFIARSVAEQSANLILVQNELGVALLLRGTLRDDKDIRYLYIIDRNKEVIVHTFETKFPADLKHIADDGAPHRIQLNGDEVLHVTAPILHGSLGTVHAGFLQSSVRHELLRMFILAAALIIILFIAAAVLMWLTIERIVIAPVQDLEHKVHNIREGKYLDTVEIVAEDEIGQLGHSFNVMAHHLSAVDQQRSNVIAELNEANTELTRIVAERELAERKFSESEEKLRLILNSAGEGIFGLDNEGRCTFCNLSSLKLLGYTSPSDLIGKNMHLKVHHSDADGTPSPIEVCQIHQALTRGEPVHVDRDLMWKADGTSFPVEYWSFPQVKDGQIVGSVVTFVDISQRLQAEEDNRQLQQMLLQSQKMDAMGTLAGGIAHDFNNILAVIYGYTELAIRKCVADKRLTDDLTQIMVASDRARELIGQILTFSRKSDIKRQPLELVPLIKETLKLLRSSIPATIEIRQQLDTNAVALADPTQIHQVMMNLCTNAYHAMAEKGGTLAVSVKIVEITDDGRAVGVEIPCGSYARIEVSDTGCGMDAVTRQKIFEPYFTTRGKGAGLGLAVVHGIVKSHGGKITVYSEVGAGSTFHVYLPLATAEADADRKGATGETTCAGSGESLLFVDDEQQIREMAGEFFLESGYRIRTCSNGNEALKAFREEPESYDLVITDMAMPGMSGKDLSRELLALRPELPIILCTGYSELINGDSARELGIREFMQKPVPLNALCAAVTKILNKSAA